MPNALQKAIESGAFQAVVDALDSGADIEAPDMHGAVGLPLRTACFRGHQKIVLELLRRGANIDAPNGQGISGPLRMALRGNHPDIVHLLIEHGASVPDDVHIPANDSRERRKRNERRQRQAGPPTGLRERRTQAERRVTSVEEVELDALAWETLFSQSQSTALQQQHDPHEHVSEIFARARD